MIKRLAVMLLLGTTGCAITEATGSGSTSANPANPPPTGAIISMMDSYYDPSVDTVQVGQHVTWIAVGKLPHGVVFTSSSGNVVALPSGGGAFDTVFSKPGSYDFACPNMIGMYGHLIVR